MLGMSNAAIIGLSLSAATATVVTVAGFNGVFDPWINPEKTVSAKQDSAAATSAPSQGLAAGDTKSASDAGDKTTAAADSGDEEQVAALPADEQAEAITPTQKPSVDIVRVEPSGDAVIAGQSDAGAMVEVLSNEEVVGKGVANAAGDWAIVLDKPLAPGAHDIAIEARRSETTEPVRADEAIAVHIPENESEGVLVATNTPGAATEVLQVPDADKTVVADLVENEGKQGEAATPTAKPETSTTSDASVSDNGTAEADPSEIIVANEPVAETPVAEAQTDEPSTPVATETGDKDPIVVAAAEPKDGVATPTDEKTRSVSPAPAAEKPDAAKTDAAQPKAEEPKVREPVVASTLLASPPVAGSALTSGNADERPVDASQPAERIEQALEAVEEKAAEPKIESTLETAALLPQAEEPAPQTAQPKAKPETDEKPAIVAKTDPKQEARPDVSEKQAKEPEPEPEPSVSVQAVEAEEGQVYVAGESKGKGPVRVYIEEKYVGQAKPNPQGQWILKAPKTIDPGQHSVRADKVQDNKGTVTARAEVVFEREADEVALTPVIAVGTGASAVAAGADVNAGKRRIPAMIIRKGDNLWRISRRHYGQGVRYTTIYQANQGQIRNPDMIFPGQVFLLPQRDLNWASN